MEEHRGSKAEHEIAGDSFGSKLIGTDVESQIRTVVGFIVDAFEGDQVGGVRRSAVAEEMETVAGELTPGVGEAFGQREVPPRIQKGVHITDSNLHGTSWVIQPYLGSLDILFFPQNPTIISLLQSLSLVSRDALQYPSHSNVNLKF